MSDYDNAQVNMWNHVNEVWYEMNYSCEEKRYEPCVKKKKKKSRENRNANKSPQLVKYLNV